MNDAKVANFSCYSKGASLCKCSLNDTIVGIDLIGFLQSYGMIRQYGELSNDTLIQAHENNFILFFGRHMKTNFFSKTLELFSLIMAHLVTEILCH